jgi:flagellar biosynthesis/type III secretory pathway M-ring protein FliF/YscJ
MNQVSWIRLRKLLLITVPIALVLIVVIAVALDWWRARDGYCVQYLPDGSQQILYGKDCGY